MVDRAAFGPQMSAVTGPVDSLPVVEAGPFVSEPVELGRLLSDGFRDDVSGGEIEQRTAVWLHRLLTEAGVALGSADCEIVGVLAAEGWSVVQVVAGWVKRANAAPPTA